MERSREHSPKWDVTTSDCGTVVSLGPAVLVADAQHEGVGTLLELTHIGGFSRKSYGQIEEPQEAEQNEVENSHFDASLRT
jgi:hypothetical protein